jgi:cullin-associated NEDD8-dissociated protein 1
VLHGGLDEQIALFYPAIETSLSTSGVVDQQSTSNLKIEVLFFLRLFFHYHIADHVEMYVDHLAPIVIQSVSDKFYKITSEAFLVCIELIKVIRPIVVNGDGEYQISTMEPRNEKYVHEILAATLNVLNTSDADQEVKERSIMCLGTLLSQVGDILDQRQAWDVLLERLRNEVTRLISVKTLSVVSVSPVVAGEEFQRCVLVAVDEISLLLRKSNRPLRIASLECLNILVQRYKIKKKKRCRFINVIFRFGSSISQKSFSNLLVELRPLITDADLHLLPLALKCTESILVISPASVDDVKASILPCLFQLIESPLLQGSALDSLLSMLAAFSKASPSDYTALVNGLVGPLLTAKTADGVSAGGVAAVANKQAASTVAQCVAVLAAHTSEANRATTVTEFQSFIQNPSANDSIKYLSLLSIGEIGRRV